jgi:hypothetical protein
MCDLSVVMKGKFISEGHLVGEYTSKGGSVKIKIQS